MAFRDAEVWDRRLSFVLVRRELYSIDFMGNRIHPYFRIKGHWLINRSLLLFLRRRRARIALIQISCSNRAIESLKSCSWSVLLLWLAHNLWRWDIMREVDPLLCIVHRINWVFDRSHCVCITRLPHLFIITSAPFAHILMALAYNHPVIIIHTRLLRLSFHITLIMFHFKGIIDNNAWRLL